MAIYRFFRIEENKENIKQSLEEHVFIINKFRKIHHIISNFNLEDDAKNLDEWKQIILTYDSEIFENYITIKEKFDVLFSFQDSIYYKSKYKRNLLELEFTDREIELVDVYKREKHEEFITRVTSWCKRLCCCLKREQIKYGDFIRKAEEGHFDKKEEDKNSVFDIDRGKVKTNTTNANSTTNANGATNANSTTNANGATNANGTTNVNGITNAINFKVTEEQSL